MVASSDMDAGLRILAVGAHPDDWEVGAAGMMQRAAEAFVLIASCGERGGNGATRSLEAYRAIDCLGGSGQVLHHQDTQMHAAKLAPDVELAVRDFRPDVILTTSPHDSHQDHVAVSAATMIATRDWTGTILAYFTPSAAERFQPNWYIGLSLKEMEKKIKLASFHQSQAARSYLAPVYLEATGRYWAQITRSTKPFVEPYELLRHKEA